jgi:hypothetical protein
VDCAASWAYERLTCGARERHPGRPSDDNADDNGDNRWQSAASASERLTAFLPDDDVSEFLAELIIYAGTGHPKATD